MALTKEEMETVVLFSRSEDGMCISTSDRTVMTKLDKLCKSSDHYRLVKEEMIDGKVVTKFYSCDDKRLLAFREERRKRNLTDEQRAEIGRRLQANREKR